jgi:undecaprenyl-diphosphatase
MTPLQALVLGIVQGLTEFLPVSSSGHLLLVPHVFGWEEQPLAFDVALHIGTLTAVLLFFRRDWWSLLTAFLRESRGHGVRVGEWDAQGRLALLIALGTVPAVIVGLFLAALEERLRTPGVVGTTMLLIAGAMAAAERWAHRPRHSGLEGITPLKAAGIGVAQACALVPGVSRSGITLAAGMFAGLSRASAARFSFLLAIPITLAAAARELPELRHASEQGISVLELGIGIGASLAVGMAAIAFLLRYLASRSLYPFVLYRVVTAVLVLALLTR